MLFRGDPVFEFERVVLDLATNALFLDLGIVPAEQFHVSRTLLLDVAAHREIRIGHGLEAQSHRGLFVEQRPIHTLGIEAHQKRPTGILPSPRHVGAAFGIEHLVGVLAVAVLDRDAVGREKARSFGRQPEQVDHIQLCHGIRLRIDRRAVHLLMGDSGLIVRHGVPPAPRGGIGFDHFLVSVKLLPVRLEELAVDLPRLLRGDVASRKPPVLMQHLSLESAEDRFDALRRSVIGSRRAVHPADVGEEALRNLAALAALVVGDDLVGLVAGGLDRHTEGAELRVEVLCVAHGVAE